MKSIALLTDFGSKDTFVASMKAVIMGISPSIRIVDITHGVTPHNVREAAFLLRTSFRYYPQGTIFVVVVDPGVGSGRHPIAIKTKNYFFIGPDNGVLHPAADADEIQKTVILTSRRYFLRHVSSTFHGRDIFAPVAAHLGRGVAFGSLGEDAAQIQKLRFPSPRISTNELRGTILYKDHFGNLVTNITQKEFLQFVSSRRFWATVKGKEISTFCSSYAEAKKGEPFFIEGSFSFLEIALKEESAARFFSIRELKNTPIVIKVRQRKGEK